MTSLMSESMADDDNDRKLQPFLAILFDIVF